MKIFKPADYLNLQRLNNGCFAAVFSYGKETVSGVHNVPPLTLIKHAVGRLRKIIGTYSKMLASFRRIP